MNDDMFEQQTPGDLSATLNSMLSGVAANYRGTVHSNANELQRNSEYDQSVPEQKGSLTSRIANEKNQQLIKTEKQGVDHRHHNKNAPSDRSINDLFGNYSSNLKELATPHDDKGRHTSFQQIGRGSQNSNQIASPKGDQPSRSSLKDQQSSEEFLNQHKFGKNVFQNKRARDKSAISQIRGRDNRQNREDQQDSNKKRENAQDASNDQSDEVSKGKHKVSMQNESKEHTFNEQTLNFSLQQIKYKEATKRYEEDSEELQSNHSQKNAMQGLVNKLTFGNLSQNEESLQLSRRELDLLAKSQGAEKMSKQVSKNNSSQQQDQNYLRTQIDQNSHQQDESGISNHRKVSQQMINDSSTNTYEEHEKEAE